MRVQQLANGSDERGGLLSLVVDTGAPDDGWTTVDETWGVMVASQVH